MKPILITSAIAAMTALPAHAYQVEMEANLNTITAETGDNTDIEQTLGAFSGTFYLKDITTNNQPLAEAAFLNRASHIDIGYGIGSVEHDDSTGDLRDQDKYDLDAKHIGFHVVTDTALIIEGAYSANETKRKNYSYKIDSIQLGLGSYFKNTGMFVVSAVKGAEEFGDSTIDIIGPQADVHYFIPLSNNNGLALDFNLGVFAVDGEYMEGARASFTAGIDYYFNPKFSLGGSIQSDAEVLDHDFSYLDYEKTTRSSVTLEGRVQYFITDQVAISGTVGFGSEAFYEDDEEIDDKGLDFVTLGLGITARF